MIATPLPAYQMRRRDFACPNGCHTLGVYSDAKWAAAKVNRCQCKCPYCGKKLVRAGKLVSEVQVHAIGAGSVFLECWACLNVSLGCFDVPAEALHVPHLMASAQCRRDYFTHGKVIALAGKTPVIADSLYLKIHRDLLAVRGVDRDGWPATIHYATDRQDWPQLLEWFDEISPRKQQFDPVGRPQWPVLGYQQWRKQWNQPQKQKQGLTIA